jgi:hypothetical protein
VEVTAKRVTAAQETTAKLSIAQVTTAQFSAAEVTTLQVNPARVSPGVFLRVVIWWGPLSSSPEESLKRRIRFLLGIRWESPGKDPGEVTLCVPFGSPLGGLLGMSPGAFSKGSLGISPVVSPMLFRWEGSLVSPGNVPWWGPGDFPMVAPGGPAWFPC